MYGKKVISKDLILQQLNDYSIFKYYNPNFIEVGKKFKSDLRVDNKADCVILSKYGRLQYNDFAKGLSLDFFSYIQLKYNLTFHEVLDLINRDFNLNYYNNTTKVLPEKSASQKEATIYQYIHNNKIETDIRTQFRQWDNTIDKEYWYNKYGITVKDLKFFQTYALKKFWISGQKGMVMFDSVKRTYGYYSGNYDDGRQIWKIYQPESKNMKWIGNTTPSIMDCYNLLPVKGKRVIITKSRKDIMVLKTFDIFSTAPQGEQMILSENIISDLKLRFEEIILLYDPDEAGITASKTNSEKYNLPFTFMPVTGDKVKDVSDFREVFGYNDTKEALRSIKLL